MKSIADEIVDGNSSSILLNETSNRRDRVFPISAISHSVVPKQKSNKPKIFNEIPRYLVKISSTLFKKATAAEVFLNRLDEKKRKQANKLEEGKEDINIRDIDPEGSTNKAKENLITNLMSDPTVVAPIKGRRKSTEVLLQQNNIQHFPLSYQTNKNLIKVSWAMCPLSELYCCSHFKA